MYNSMCETLATQGARASYRRGYDDSFYTQSSRGRRLSMKSWYNGKPRNLKPYTL